MGIDIFGEIKAAVFWPEEAVQEVFKKAEGAIGSPDEPERLRSFYRSMKLFYDVSSSSSYTPEPHALAALYEYAKKGLEAAPETGKRNQHGKT